MDSKNQVYAVESEKSVERFVEDLSAVLTANNFIVNNPQTMDLKQTFVNHGQDVPDDFDLHMIQVCKPDRAAGSLTGNPERAVLMPKFIHVFSRAGRTNVRYLSYGEQEIRELVPADSNFPASLAQTAEKICAMIDEAR